MPESPKSSRHKNVKMTPEQRARWRREVVAIEEEKPELTRWANDVQARKRAMLQEVTELLQAARESSGMTLDQLQQATGIDAAQLSKLLKADGNPTLYTLQRVADALGKRLVFTLAEK
ncbi:MAG: helix-turn-helix transcriptional regulator [Planctomycetaceae bacterium]